MEEIAQTLEGFLPLDLLRRIHGARGERPASVEFSAAVIFVDVSRYTALVEQLARRGKEGLAQIPQLLSHSYARCAEIICGQGGEVLYFAGDSLLAYWDADKTGLSSAVKTAAECARAICEESRVGVISESTPERPTLHIGVGAGQLWVAAVGGDPVWNLVAAGDAVRQAARSHSLAHGWEFVLSREASIALAGENLAGTGTAEGIPCVQSLDPEWLIGFLPMPLQEILRESTPILPKENEGQLNSRKSSQRTVRSDALAEIRPVSIVFARISGLEDQRASALAAHQKVSASLQRISIQNGGPAGELLFDDKGLIFVSAFGARGAFHRDDPTRAILTALSIHQCVKQFGLIASIGVATGEALFRVVGSLRRRQLMVLGPPVNRAARLVATASDDVICDEPTERASRAAYTFDRCGSLQLEGLGDIASVFRPLELSFKPTPHSILIGREGEAAFLDNVFQEVRQGDSRLVMVVGEPGIGKTRLIAAFTENLRLAGIDVSVSPAERDDRRSSLLAWRKVLAGLLGLPPNAEGSVILQGINARLPTATRITDRLPLLSDVLSIDMPQNEGTRHLEGAHRADAMMRLLGDLVGALAPRPLALVLEDCQWLDSASWRLVEWVLGSVPALLLVLCIRSGEVSDEFLHLRRRTEAANVNAPWSEADDVARMCRILELDELNDTSIKELVGQTLGDVRPHDELAGRIATLSGGNPFFAEEIALTLKSEGLIAVRDGLWRPIRPLQDLYHFEGVERVIRERIDRLDGTSQDVLKAAAVVGRSFSILELQALLRDEVGEHSLRLAVERLVDAHLVRQFGQSGRYEFRHDQTRDVVYGSIPTDLRLQLHEGLALWLERSQLETPGGDLSVLVQHFEASNNKGKVVKYADLAATRALQMGAFREVEAFLNICMAHEAKDANWSTEQRLRAVQWRRKLAEAHYSRGDIHAQGVAIRRALSMAGHPVPNSSAMTYVRFAVNAVRLALQQLMPSHFSKIIGREDLRAWEREMARCLNQAATVDYFELRFTRGMSNLFEAVSRAERTGWTIELAIASSQLACGFGIMGRRSLCQYFMGKAERIAIQLKDPAIQSHVYGVDALWQVGRGEWAALDRRITQAQELCLQAGDQLRWCNAETVRFWSLYYRGDQSALEPSASALLARSQNAGNIQQEIWALRCKALCALNADQPRVAVDILRLITSAMFGSVDQAAQISVKGTLSLALARTGNHAESVNAAAETLRLLRASNRPTSHSTLVGLSGICEVFLRGREANLSSEYEEWLQWEAQAIRELRRYTRVFPIGAPQLALWYGMSLWLEGREDYATSIWKEGMALAQRLSLRRDEVIIAAELRRRRDRL
ncbi:AAA family ATPase [Rhizobium leguminosarum]|uniref:AAA family ATPase n=1 Tax=Rhizobium leguminosarum TaxID=384 RepID=UPI003F97C7CC